MATPTTTLTENWQEITTAPAFTAQVLSRRDGEFVRAASLPAAADSGVMIGIGKAVSDANLSGSGNLYGRSYGGSTTPCTIILLT